MAFGITSSLGKVIPAPYGAPVPLYQDAQVEISHSPNARQTRIMTRPGGKSPTEVFAYRDKIRCYRPGRWIEHLDALYGQAEDAERQRWKASRQEWRSSEVFREVQQDQHELFRPVSDS